MSLVTEHERSNVLSAHRSFKLWIVEDGNGRYSVNAVEIICHGGLGMPPDIE